MIFRKLYYSIGPKTRRIVRRLLYLPLDILGITSNGKSLIPPKGQIFTGAGDFAETGDRFIRLAKNKCALSPDYRVLDIGCGIGRIARPMAGFLENSGSYTGFDIVPDGIAWCKKKYAAFPNFRFQYIPLKNDLYNLGAKQQAQDFTFPYASNSFDLVLSISVFTHMQLDEVRRYLQESSRVLAEGKYLLCSFFVIWKNAGQQEIEQIAALFPFIFKGFRLHHSKVRDANVAYDEEVLTTLFEEAGLRTLFSYPGWWSNENKKQELFDYQDVFILTKSARHE